MVTSIDEVKEAILEHIKTCPKCGVDLEMWRKMVHEEHYCRVAENLEDYWRHLQSGAEQC